MARPLRTVTSRLRQQSHVLVRWILVCSVLALVPLANARPPDPSWIEGIYDGADHDDVVQLAVSLSGIIEPGPATDCLLSLVPGWRPADTCDVATIRLPARHGRSPPAFLPVSS